MPSSFAFHHQVTKPRSKVIKMDLSDANAQKLIVQWVCYPGCVWVHFGIPCGTSSRARDIKMSRSHRHTMAHHLCGRCSILMKELILQLPATTFWTIENPLRSWLCSTSYLKAIERELSVYFVRFEMCMCSGKRPKKIGLATNCKHLENYQIVCDGQHEHLRFGYRDGKCDTSTEAACPAKFCHTLVKAIVEALQLPGDQHS